jgi:hypothetical protein
MYGFALRDFSKSEIRISGEMASDESTGQLR